MQFTGSFVALLTPFRQGVVDERAFQDFVAWQIAEGTDGLVPCGTTGESPTLSHDEHKRVIELTIEVAKGKATIMAGAGSNSTAEAIDFTRHAQKAGADAVLSVCPYYNRPTQEGLYQHYKAIHESSDIPIFIYNIPGRSGVDMSIDTMKRLAELPRIVGVKDATADLARPLRTKLAIGADFIQLSGEDITVVPYLAQGGHGCISVTANVAPRLCAELHRAWHAGDLAKVTAINDRLAPLSDAMFVESSPAPVKYAVSLLGKCQNEIRGPLVPASANARDRVDAAMRQVGLIN
ncbi:MAG TPA: 4-hydroxy-tetrahydrodipicolinate synthase [Aliidongia sp.]|nr:4-hydroxy-tetrahydrodipicolinate synthase [Aliidongia sp.]